MRQINNPMIMIQKFNEFKNSFTGNPEEEVKKLLASGRISQNQLNQLQAMATQFEQFLKINK